MEEKNALQRIKPFAKFINIIFGIMFWFNVVGCVVIIILTGWIGYLIYDFKKWMITVEDQKVFEFITSPNFYLIIFLLLGVVFLATAVIFLIRKIIKSIIQENPFQSVIAKYVRNIGILIIGIGAINLVGQVIINKLLTLEIMASIMQEAPVLIEIQSDFTPFWTGAFIIILSAVFKYGVELKEENNKIKNRIA